jgi:hypothetical protein
MAIFPYAELESIVQVDDKTRIDATKSFKSKDEAAVSLVRIKPEASGAFITVTGTTSKDWYLDWSYATAGSKVVTVEITTNGAATTKTFTITVVSEATDNLFSSDADLTAFEYDVLNYIPAGRNSFKDVHRKAQNLILAWLDENGHTDTNGERLTKTAITELEEVKYMSAAWALKLIYQALSNAVDDVFSQKSKYYESLMVGHRNRLILRLDKDGDGTAELGEGVTVKSMDMVRR